MTLTCILVDMENVQLRVPDLSALERGRHQLKIFHGPSQNKLTIEMVRALQPLGDAVEYIQCEKAGPNALDFHLAFHLGRLTAAQPDARYLIVSRDKGFAQLVAHANKLGGRVEQHASLPADIVGSAATSAPVSAAGKARTTRSTRATATESAPTPAPARKAAATKTAAKTAARKAPAKKAAAAKTVTAPAASPAPAVAPAAKKVPAKKAAAKQAPARKTGARADTSPAILPPAAPARSAGAAPDPAAAPAAKPTRDIATATDRAKAIATLQKLGAKRPVTQRALLRHLQSHLGHDLSDGAVQALVDALVAAGVVALAQGKLTYHLGA